MSVNNQWNSGCLLLPAPYRSLFIYSDTQMEEVGGGNSENRCRKWYQDPASCFVKSLWKQSCVYDLTIFFARKTDSYLLSSRKIETLLGLLKSYIYGTAGPKKVLPMHQVSFIRERYKGIGTDSKTLCWLVRSTRTLMCSTGIYYLYIAKSCLLPP